MGHRLASSSLRNCSLLSLHPQQLKPSCSPPPHSFFSGLGPGEALSGTGFQNQAKIPGKTPRLLT